MSAMITEAPRGCQYAAGFFAVPLAPPVTKARRPSKRKGVVMNSHSTTRTAMGAQALELGQRSPRNGTDRSVHWRTLRETRRLLAGDREVCPILQRLRRRSEPRPVTTSSSVGVPPARAPRRAGILTNPLALPSVYQCPEMSPELSVVTNISTSLPVPVPLGTNRFVQWLLSCNRGMVGRSDRLSRNARSSGRPRIKANAPCLQVSP